MDEMDDRTKSADHDRIVHAVMHDKCEVVRYDIAGKWYREGTSHNQHKRSREMLTVDEAVSLALTAKVVYLHQYGGAVFSRRFLRRTTETHE